MSDINRSPSSTSGKCPVMHGANTTIGTSAMDFWRKALNLDIGSGLYEVRDRRLVRDFVAAWTKVMNADRFELAVRT